MKTRIRIVENNKGEKTFYAEYKNFSYGCFIFIIIPIYGWVYIWNEIFKWTKIDTTLDFHEAKQSIDDFLQQMTEYDFIKYNKKIKSVTYFKYP